MTFLLTGSKLLESKVRGNDLNPVSKPNSNVRFHLSKLLKGLLINNMPRIWYLLILALNRSQEQKDKNKHLKAIFWLSSLHETYKVLYIPQQFY